MESFNITVTEIEKQEYVESCRQLTKRLYRMLAIAMLVVCGVILLLSEQFTYSAILIPVFIYLLVVVVAEVWSQTSYRDSMRRLDNLYYEFGPLRWAVNSGDERLEFDWVATPKMVKTKNCIFVYPEPTRSNLVPRRLLTTEQEMQISQWYEETRLLAKEYQRKREAEESVKQRNNKKSPFLNQGPSWGPLKNQKGKK